MSNYETFFIKLYQKRKSLSNDNWLSSGFKVKFGPSQSNPLNQKWEDWVTSNGGLYIWDDEDKSLDGNPPDDFDCFCDAAFHFGINICGFCPKSETTIEVNEGLTRCIVHRYIKDAAQEKDNSGHKSDLQSK